MEFEIGDTVQVKNSGSIGKIIDIDSKSICNIVVEFNECFSYGHDCNGKGKFGHCYYYYEKDVMLIKKRSNDMSIKSLITRLIDKDTALLMDEVMIDGNLNLNDARVQEALMKTDGFRNNLLDILKKEKE